MSSLSSILARLVAGERVTTADPELAQQLVDLGVEQTEEGQMVWPSAVVPLDASRIERALSEAARGWLGALDVLPVVVSTSTLLLERAQAGSIDGQVITAECQLGGRGRLGRRWLSPLGTNLAVSIGVRVALQPSQLGGLTLAVGLALLEALDPQGLLGLSLKWPNDVLGPNGKLSGILVELATHDAQATELVIGIGINLAVPAAAEVQVPQPIQNFNALPLNEPADRSLLLAAVVSEVLAFVWSFQNSGFAPFMEVFDQHHRLQDQACVVSGAGEPRGGIVRGVDAQGCLLLETDSGIEPLLSGEVSVRPR